MTLLVRMGFRVTKRDILSEVSVHRSQWEIEFSSEGAKPCLDCMSHKIMISLFQTIVPISLQLLDFR